MDAIRRWHALYLKKGNLTVFVTYPAKDGARDFVDDSLIKFFNTCPTGAVSGGGSFFSPGEEPICITDVDLIRPFHKGYRDLVLKLREMEMPPETILRSAFGIVPLYEIRLPVK